MSAALSGISPAPRGYPSTDRWCLRDKPVVSLVILNDNNTALTQRCLDSIWQNTAGLPYEVLVVDNGSNEGERLRLGRVNGCFRSIAIGDNRFLGESINIGVESAQGRYIALIGNSVTVTPDWLALMISLLEMDTTIGAVGPKIVHPDGTLQHSWALLEVNGHEVRIAKEDGENLSNVNRIRRVDCCSSIALLVRRGLFEQILGFDLAWEPSSYQDIDLCLKIAQCGQKVYYCPESVVGSQRSVDLTGLFPEQKSDPFLDVKRTIFNNRWGAFLAGTCSATPKLFGETAQRPPELPSGAVKKVAIFSPYDLLPGGGERFFLTLAEILSREWIVTVVTPARYSRARLLTMARELNLDLSRVRLMALDEQKKDDIPDVFICVGNEGPPPLPGMGRASIYVCQFPFPMSRHTMWSRLNNLDTYHNIIVYSSFVKKNYERFLAEANVRKLPVDILYPPCETFEYDPFSKDNIILSVGRFFVGGHNKRQDILIKAVRSMIAKDVKVELHLAGSWHTETWNRDYFLNLRSSARDVPVFFHPNASREELKDLYRCASIYWQGTGYDADPENQPALCEHFGIAVVEAMSAGCIPVVVGKGGHLETVGHGENGFHFLDIDTLINLSRSILLDREKPWVIEMREAAISSSKRFSREVFAREAPALISEMLDGLPGGSSSAASCVKTHGPSVNPIIVRHGGRLVRQTF